MHGGGAGRESLKREVLDSRSDASADWVGYAGSSTCPPKVFPKHSSPQGNLSDMAQVVLSPIGQPNCAWTQGSRKFAIHVHPDVLARLAMEVRVAFKRVPRRGLEVGGILLGRTDQRNDTTTFWMEGFESIDSEHRSGPSYLLSEPDLVLLREALTRKRAASIGIFRSQTRSQELLLEEADSKLFGECFGGGNALFLLACPVAAKAAFFVRENGEMRCVYEFGLGPSLATGVAAQDVSASETDEIVQPPIQAALLAVSKAIPPADQADTATASVPLFDRAIEGNRFGRALDRGLVKPQTGSLRRGAGFKKGTWLLAALMLSAFLGAAIGVLSHSRPPSIHPQALPANDLHLTVAGSGGSLRLHWDQNTSGIRNPSRAVLHIQDGEYQMVRNLTPAEFNAGNVAYEPRSREVSFRVELFSPTANASGSVQVVNLPAQAALTPVRPAEPIYKPPASNPATELPTTASKSTAARSEPVAVAPVPVAEEKKDNRTSAVKAVIPAEGSDAAAVAKRDPSPPADIVREPKTPVAEQAARPNPVPEPTVRVWTEAVAGSPWGRLVGKVPLVRRLRRPAKTLPAAPIFQAQPVLTNAAKQSITRPVRVDVRVDVGETGAVESAEVIEFSDPLNVALTNSALAAAVRWTFEPARSDEDAVSSKVILHFRFTP